MNCPAESLDVSYIFEEPRISEVGFPKLVLTTLMMVTDDN